MKYLRPRIKPIYPVYKLTDTVFRIGAQKNITMEFDDPTGELWDLIQNMDGREITDILVSLQRNYPHLTSEDLEYGITLLDNENFIEEFHEEVRDRYTGNRNYFKRFVADSITDSEIQKKINQSTILLLGLGGGGSLIATLLSGLGPKKLIVVDYDVVEESNLGRQFLYTESDIGRKKVDTAVSRLRLMNSNIDLVGIDKKIISENDVLELLSGVDLTICVIDEPPAIIQRLVNKAVVKASVPCVFGGSQVSRGRVYSVIPGKSGCFDCLNIEYTKRDPNFINQFKGHKSVNFHLPTIAYGPAMFQLAGAITDEAIKILTGFAEPQSVNCQFEIDYEKGASFIHQPWKSYPEECPTCGKGREEDWEIFSYYDM